MSTRDHRCPGGAATSTVALLATLGVAQAQSVELLGVTGAGSSAATKVTNSADDVVGLGQGLELGLESIASLIGADRFWCRVGGAISDSTFGFSSSTTDVSRSGSHGVGWNSLRVGIRWAKNQKDPEALGGLDGTPEGTFPLAISGDGSVVVGASEDSTGALQPFVWMDGGAGVQALGLLPGSLVGMATDVTPDGSVIIGMCEAGGSSQWCRWVNGGPPEALPVFGEAHGISANGAVIVGRDEDLRAVALIDGVVVDLGDNGFALAASDDGRIIVGSDGAGVHAWRWTARDGIQHLDDLLSGGTVGPVPDFRVAAGISPCGELIVGWAGETTIDIDLSFDAPDGPLDYFEAGGHSIVGQIDGDPASDGRDAYVIEIADPDAFLATTSSVVHPDASATFDTRLWLFDEGGFLILANDDGPDGPPYHSTICDPADFSALTGGILAPTAPLELQPGRYVLVISGFPDDPLDATATPLADLSDFDALHGSAPGFPFFNTWETAVHAGGSYEIVLRGVALAPFAFVQQEGFVATFDPHPDIDGDGLIGFTDLLAVLSKWGPCSDCCPEDLNGDGMVGFNDLLIVTSQWD